MKQLFTIFLLCTMLLLQYSKQLAYLQCRISNVIQTDHCDCEKIMAVNAGEDMHNNMPVSLAKVLLPDELFQHANDISLPAYYLSTLQKPTAFNTLIFPQDYTNLLLQPPRG